MVCPVVDGILGVMKYCACSGCRYPADPPHLQVQSGVLLLGCLWGQKSFSVWKIVLIPVWNQSYESMWMTVSVLVLFLLFGVWEKKSHCSYFITVPCYAEGWLWDGAQVMLPGIQVVFNKKSSFFSLALTKCPFFPFMAKLLPYKFTDQLYLFCISHSNESLPIFLISHVQSRTPSQMIISTC